MQTNENTTSALQDGFQLDLTPGVLKTTMKDLGASSVELWTLPPEKILIIDGFNVRLRNEKYRARVRELADSMKVHGYMKHKPMAGFITKFADGSQGISLTDGHTRMDAIELANSELPDHKKITKVTIVAHETKKTSMTDLNVQLVQGNKGSALEPIEVAIVCNRLRTDGMDVHEIARQTGFSTEWVSGLFMIFDSPPELRQMVVDGVIKATFAIEVIKQHRDNALAVLQKALAEKTGTQPAASASNAEPAGAAANANNAAAGDDDGGDASEATSSGAVDDDGEGTAVPTGEPKVKLTAKDLVPKEVRKFNNAVKKQAPALYGLVKELKEDKSFDKIPEALREKVLTVLDELAKHQAPDEPAVDPRQTGLFQAADGNSNQKAAA